MLFTLLPIVWGRLMLGYFYLFDYPDNSIMRKCFELFSFGRPDNRQCTVFNNSSWYIKQLSNKAELNIANYSPREVISNEAVGRVRYHLHEDYNLQYSTKPSSITVLSYTSFNGGAFNLLFV